MGHLKGDDGAISHHGVWKAQKNLISKGIKTLCLEEILERVWHRKIHPELQEMEHMKEILCERRLNIVKHIKSEPWSMRQLYKVLISLKKKKCCDPQGYINELFQYDSLG